jgi:hypothetical protein
MVDGSFWTGRPEVSARAGAPTSPTDSTATKSSALTIRRVIRNLLSVEELAADRRSAGRTALSSRAVFVTGRSGDLAHHRGCGGITVAGQHRIHTGLRCISR